MKDMTNFIIILTDDQGYGDLSCMGSEEIRTPNIDRLAASGARFTDWYSGSPVCSPSRAALLTGRYPGSAGIRQILAGGRHTEGLMPNTPTLSSELKKLGYRCALFGKWHLGTMRECWPDKHGFDEWMGFLSGCIDYYSHIYYWDMANGRDNAVHDLWLNGEEIYRDGEYFTEMVTRFAVEFIRKTVKSEKPFFLFVSYNAPHYPMHAPQKYTERFKELPWDRRIMAAMLSAVDDGVGEIIRTLSQQKVLDNTLIFFQSDNGPSREARNWLDGRKDPYYGGHCGILKGHKYSLFEGGIRVPAIISWPKKIPAGQLVRHPASAMDIFPTFMQVACNKYKGCNLDGMNILPYVTDGYSPDEREIFWEFMEQTAVRRGKWKLVINGRLEEEYIYRDNLHLANLEEDMGERFNLKDVYPDITEELKYSCLKWRAEIEGKTEKKGLCH